VPHTRFDGKARSKDACNGAGLGRRLDDHKRICHEKVLNSACCIHLVGNGLAYGFLCPAIRVHDAGALIWAVRCPHKALSAGADKGRIVGVYETLMSMNDLREGYSTL
jgi:hypothetical protein